MWGRITICLGWALGPLAVIVTAIWASRLLAIHDAACMLGSAGHYGTDCDYAQTEAVRSPLQVSPASCGTRLSACYRRAENNRTD